MRTPSPTASIQILSASLALISSAPAALWLDFNSGDQSGGTPITGDPGNPLTPLHNEPGYQSYHVVHESAAQLTPPFSATYNTNFALTGAANVSLLPDWPNSTAYQVRQSIGRTNAQADMWQGNNTNLLRDWIGIDSRAPGNGAWNGTVGTPTYMTLTLGGLPAAQYSMTTFHHDVENMNSFFTLEVSTDGGATYGSLINGRMTNSLGTGTPAENIFVNALDGDPANLSSTQNFMFDASGSDNVVLRFAPLGPATVPSQTHQMFFGINGFQLEQVPEPAASVMGLVGACLLLRRRRC